MDVLLNNDVETVDFGESAMRVKLTREVIEVKEINDIGSVRILMLKGEKGDVGYPTDEQVSEAVDEWLTAHPEATTTVQDNSLTWVKFNDVLKNMMFKLGITDSKSGELVSTSDAAEFPLKDLQSEITATQNLNGYEYPWVGGAGKNKINRGTIDVIPNIIDSTALATMFLKSGTYTLSYTLDTTVTATRNRATCIIGSETIYGNDITTAGRGSWTFTLEEDATVRLNWWYHTVSTACTISDFQLEIGSTATAYVPYENICPISGRTEVNVTRTGNIDFTASITKNKNIDADGTISDTPMRSATIDAIEVEGSKSYSISYTTSCRNGVFFYDTDDNFISFYSWGSAPRTFTTPQKTKYVRFSFDTADTVENALLTYGDTFNTKLGRTVYGGTLDLTTGELTVNTGLIASYNGETIGEPWISDRDRYVAGTTPTIGAQVVYTKDSETYQVDRTEVDAYFKNNTIWSDSGDVAVSYLVDAKTYIDNQ